MNHLEILGLAMDFHKDSGETDEPGADSTRRPHVPAGIAIPQRRARWHSSTTPRVGPFDKTFGARVVNLLLSEEENETAYEMEDALIDAIDARSRRRNALKIDAKMPKLTHGHARIVRALAS